MSLPYPISNRIRVYRDDGQWPDRWFMRAQHVIDALYVCTYELRVDDDGDVDLTATEWSTFAKQLQDEHGDCVFVYT